jgi:hypothetical protein
VGKRSGHDCSPLFLNPRIGISENAVMKKAIRKIKYMLSLLTAYDIEANLSEELESSIWKLENPVIASSLLK